MSVNLSDQEIDALLDEVDFKLPEIGNVYYTPTEQIRRNLTTLQSKANKALSNLETDQYKKQLLERYITFFSALRYALIRSSNESTALIISRYSAFVMMKMKDETTRTVYITLRLLLQPVHDVIIEGDRLFIQFQNRDLKYVNKMNSGYDDLVDYYYLEEKPV